MSPQGCVRPPLFLRLVLFVGTCHESAKGKQHCTCSKKMIQFHDLDVVLLMCYSNNSSLRNIRRMSPTMDGNYPAKRCKFSLLFEYFQIQPPVPRRRRRAHAGWRAAAAEAAQEKQASEQPPK